VLTAKSWGLLGVGVCVALLIPAVAVTMVDIRRLVHGRAHPATVVIAVIVVAVLLGALLLSARASGRT
jgi:hypothetical protein